MRVNRNFKVQVGRKLLFFLTPALKNNLDISDVFHVLCSVCIKASQPSHTTAQVQVYSVTFLVDVYNFEPESIIFGVGNEEQSIHMSTDQDSDQATDLKTDWDRAITIISNITDK